MPNYVELVFDMPLKQSFIYEACGGAGTGKRALAPFGRREITGFIIAEHDRAPPLVPPEKIKPLKRVIDKEALFGAAQIDLAEWIAGYYLCGKGEALSAMLPSGRRVSGPPSFDMGGIDEDVFQESRLTLSQGQAAALEAVCGGAKDAPKLFYLYGITGSGKTEVFLRAAEYFLNIGKSVIYLVPEISLTHQTAELVSKRFGDRAATMHSMMSGTERLAEWIRIKRGGARIVVGPRSAVFAPLSDIGLIVIDEEHDSSFKSGSTPRYHGRQVAMRLCAVSGAALLMGSATPSAEAWKLMEDGKIKRLNLGLRLSGGSLPLIKPVNIEHSSGCLSAELQEEIRRTAAMGRQSILFLNRRGFAYFYHCSNCGFELTCKRCSVSLTWHKAQGRAVCHYCGYEEKPPAACPKCGSLEAGFSGAGTEMVEEEVRRRFPGLNVRRVDSDTVGKKGGLENALATFKAGAIDILMGTQMVAKGLNFPGVRLVGVIFADTGLHIPDFRAAERVFSLIVQVAGRAGRFFPDGKVIVQTMRPFDNVIRAACALDVEGFFKAELENRLMQGFPPFSRIIRITARGRDKERARAAIARFFSFARRVLPSGADILGPAECPLAQIAGNWRFHVLLRGKDISTLHRAARAALEEYETGADAKVYLEVDVDPAQIM